MASADVTVCFDGEGPLGLALVEAGAGVVIKTVRPNTLAANMPELHGGMVLRTFQPAGQPEPRATDGMAYKDILGMLKGSPRPLRLGFDEGVGTQQTVSVTFTEAGTLGLKFTPNKQTGNVELLQVNPGTQAERHSQLTAGLILRSVAGASVAGKSYQEVLGMIKAGGRPLPMTFSLGGTVATSPRVSPKAAPPRKPAAPADPTEGLTGKAAQKALQDHIMKSGTGDVKKIDRLRRASLQPDSKAPPSGQKAQNDAAAMMAAAMAEVDDEDEDEAAQEPQPQGGSGSVSVTFTEAGTLGLKFTPNKQTGNVELLQVNPGTQAERHSQLTAGLILRSVAGASVAGKSYQEVLGMIKAGGRPLPMTFSPGGTVATSPRRPIQVTFTEAGTLGLKFTPNKQTGNVELLQVNPGTQAERHSQLTAGLILRSVAGASVAGKSYQEVLGMIKAGGRPLPMTFSPGGTVATSPRVSPKAAPPRKPAAPADPTEGLTGKAAQKALQDHIMKSGTGDVKKIDRLRRASLQPDSKAPPSGQKAQNDAAAMMAAAMAEVDDEDEDEAAQEPQPQGGSGSVSVTFTEAGTLGLKFTPNKQTGNVELLQVNPGTQAERHSQLTAGLILRSVAGASVAGKSYQEVLGMIKAGGRPLPMTFSPGGTVATSPRVSPKAAPPRKPAAPADPTEGLTGKAAQKALQDHIMKSGTGDVKKIDRLRRASLQPDSKAPPSGQKAQNDAAAMMAAAMAEVDDEDEDEAAQEPQPQGGSGSVSVTFTEAGTLGLKFTPNKQTGNVELLQVNPGTQAERHSQLTAGLILRSVAGASVAGKSYQEVLGMIKAGGRPLPMTFSPGGTVATSPRVSPKAAPPRKPAAPADPTEGLTGKAAQKALQDHIMKSGTGDVKKIDRLRRASLQPDSKAPPSGQKAQNDAAAMMAAAMAEVDDEDEDEAAQEPQPQGGSGSVSVTFTEAGTLGLKFTPNKQTGNVELLQVNPGTQAERHSQLTAGLILRSVAGASVAGKSYQEVLGMIKAGGRPLPMTFSPGGTVATSPMAASLRSSNAPMSVTFEAAGPLGLKFVPHKVTSDLQLLSVNPGSQAEQHKQLVPGLVVESIGGTPATGKGYDAALNMIKGAGRPVTLTFKPGAISPRARSPVAGSPASVATGQGSVAVTFTEAGTLGLKFTPNKQTGNVELLQVNPGTQAERHSQLTAGLILRSVAGASVAGKSYQEVLGMIKAGGRPLPMTFSPGGTVATSSSASKPQLSALPSDAVSVTFSVVGPLGLRFVQNAHTKSIDVVSINAGSQAERQTQLKAGMSLFAVESTLVAGKSYQDVLQLIKSAGRPLTLVFRPPKASSAFNTPVVQPQSSNTYVPAAPKRKAPATGKVSVTFTKTGPLGVKFVSRGNHVIVLSISPQSQAAEHAALRPGLVVCSVAGVEIAGKTYPQVIDVIRKAARPTTIVFDHSPPGVGGAQSDSPRLLNAVMVELTAWLDLRNAGQYADGVRDAFVKSSFRPETWIAELEDMDDDELSMFLNAVRRVELPGSSRTIQGQNGGVRSLPVGFDGRPMDQAEKDRRASHVSRFYGIQQRGRLRDLESGLRSIELLQYASKFRQKGITNSTEISSLFLDLDDQDSTARTELFEAYGIMDPEHQSRICEWIGLEIRKLPPPIKIISPPGSRRGSPPRDRPDASLLEARTTSEPVSVTFAKPGSLGIRFIEQNGQCVIKGILPDTQASLCPELVPNLVLTNVSGRSCDGLSYNETLEMLKQGGRPVSLLFVHPGGTISPKTMNSTIQQQEENEVANSPMRPEQRREAAEEIRGRHEQEERELEAQPIEVTFTDAGSLGITFSSRAAEHGGAPTSPPFIKALIPGGMAAACGKLRPNLFLVEVNGARVVDYTSAIAAIKAAGRPITLVFSTTAELPETPIATDDGFKQLEISELLQDAEAHVKARDHGAAMRAYGKVLEIDSQNPLAREGYTNCEAAVQMAEATAAADELEREEEAAKAAEEQARTTREEKVAEELARAAQEQQVAEEQTRAAQEQQMASQREKELEEMRKMRAIEEKLAEDKRVQAIVQRSLAETEVEQPSGSRMALVPAEDAQTDLGEEMRKLQALADAPETPGASAVSPTIYAGTPRPALSGVLANAEGLSAFEQIIKLREVLAAMREAARQDAETAQQQLEELQMHAPDRIQEAYRRGTEQGKEIVDALVSQSRDNLHVKMSEYRTRKAEWEKRLALIQAGGQLTTSATVPPVRDLH